MIIIALCFCINDKRLTKFFYEYLLKDEQDLSVGEMLTVYFGTPNMFITLWFGFAYGTILPQGTLII
jgi:hypothetical protein